MEDNRNVIKNPVIVEDPFAKDPLPFVGAMMGEELRFLERLNACFEGIEGQEYARQAITEYLFGLKYRENAKGAGGLLFFAGAPAVGKTIMAERIAKALKRPFYRADLSGYSDRESAVMDFAGINGSYKEAAPGVITEFVYNHPVSVLLLDEAEKASPQVLLLLLQILERGEIEDKYHKKMVNFRDVLIIITSNAGRDIYDRELGKYIFSGTHPSVIVKSLQKETNPLTKTRVFSDALISRFTMGKMIMFNKLRPEIIHKILVSEIEGQIEYYSKLYKVKIDMDKKLLAELFMMNLGESADIRMLTQECREHFRKHLSRSVEEVMEQEENTFFDKIEYHIDMTNASAEVKALMHHNNKSRVLVYGGEAQIESFRAHESDRVEFIYVDKSLSLSKLFKLDLSAAVLNVADDDDEFVPQLFDRLVDMNNIAVYTYRMDKAGRAKFLYYTDHGSTECYSPRISSLSMDAWLGRILQGMDLCYVTEQLFRANQVIRYETTYRYDPAAELVKIKLSGMRVETHMDAGEADKFVTNRAIPDVSFDAIIGAEDAKKELRSCLKYLTNPRKYIREGRRIPRGIILSGEPGTGKTTLAKALAAEAKLPFIQKNATEFLQKYVGDGAKSIRELFASARRYAPAIIFIDEIDVIAKSRMSREAETHYTADLVNTFLSMMDGFNTQNEAPVFVMAATNFSLNKEDTKLDEAFLRRFDKKIHIDLPDFGDRKCFLERRLEAFLGRGVSAETVDSLAKRSVGWNLADLGLVVENAIRLSDENENGVLMTNEDLVEAFESFFDGKARQYDESELRQTAYHEAGHTLIAHEVLGKPPVYTTITARSHYGGYMYYANEEKGSFTKQELLDRICISLAGRAAEVLVYGDDGITTGASGDLKKATELARSLICDYGMDSFAFLALNRNRTGDDDRIIERISRILEEQYERAQRIISERRSHLDALTEALMARNSLTETDMAEIFSA